MEFYVYVWRDGAGVPFYVGKGKGRRAYDVAARSDEFKDIHATGGCAVEIVDWFIHESQAHAHEVELIERYGRRELGGLLVNKTDGGEGQSGAIVSESKRELMRTIMTGRTFSQDAIAKMSASASNRSPEHQAKLTAAIAMRSPEVYAKIAASNRGRKNSPEVRARMNVEKIGVPLSAEHRAKIGVASLGRRHTEETRAKMSANNAMLSPENRAKVSAGLKGRIVGPETRERIRLALRMQPPKGDFKGVFPSRKRWQARIQGGGGFHIGTFDTPELAALAYDQAAYAAWGDACFLNFPDKTGGTIAA